MLKRGVSVDKDVHVWGEDPTLDEPRTTRFPVRPRSGKAKPSGNPKAKAKGIAPDAKRYNDEIPDPDAEDTVPE